MFKKEFPGELAALRSLSLDAARKRSETDPETILSSGRTVSQDLELLEELRGVLLDRWKLDEYASVPGPIRDNLMGSVRRVKARITEYGNGQTGPQELQNEVDQLHVLLWQNNVLSLDPGEERFASKNRQLERLKDKGRRINRELRGGLSVKQQLRKALEEVDGIKAGAEAAQATSTAALGEIQSAQASAVDSQNRASGSAEEAARLEATSSESANRTKATENEIGALKEKVRLFFDDIEKNEKRLEDLQTDSDKRIGDLEERSRTLVNRNTDLEQRVELQLQKATGASLFHAFQQRRGELTKAKWIWAVISVGALVLTVVWSIYLATSAGSLDTAFFVRLGGTLPVLALVVFCLSQYGRERRAEEEYAFKSALSLSLVPYKDLIEELEVEGTDAEYAKFLTSTIGQIYTAPRLTRESGRSAGDRSVLKTMEAVNDLVEKLVNR